MHCTDANLEGGDFQVPRDGAETRKMDRWKGTDARKTDIQAVESRRLGEELDVGVRAGGKHSHG